MFRTILLGSLLLTKINYHKRKSANLVLLKTLFLRTELEIINLSFYLCCIHSAMLTK